MLSWVRAQEAYVCYYSGNLAEALAVTAHAQALAGRTACVGVPLAAALEARARAALGHRRETLDALARAEAAVDRLRAADREASAFGYNEAQLRFHEGNALTHLHDTESAWQAQQRALELYPPADFLDRTLVQLDRAQCLAHAGEVPAALEHATRAIDSLSGEQRQGLVISRGRDLWASLPAAQQALPAAREFRDLLTVASREERGRK